MVTLMLLLLFWSTINSDRQQNKICSDAGKQAKVGFAVCCHLTALCWLKAKPSQADASPT